MAALAIFAGVAYGQDGRGEGLGGRGAGPILGQITEATGLTVLGLREGLASGQTIAQVIVENGGSVEEVTQTLVDLATGQIEARVAEGLISQEAADALIAGLPATVDALLNAAEPVRQWDGRGAGMGRENGLVRQVLEATGLTAAEQHGALADGSTLADVLAANNVDVDQFIEDLIAGQEERLTEALIAGRINEAVLDARLALWRAELEFRLSQPVATD